MKALDGSLVSLPGHTTYTPDTQITVTVPWLPTASAASQQLAFVVFARDVFGMEAGPFPALQTLTVQAPACDQPCSVTSALLVYAACLTCAQLLPVAQLNQVPDSVAVAGGGVCRISTAAAIAAELQGAWPEGTCPAG